MFLLVQRKSQSTSQRNNEMFLISILDTILQAIDDFRCNPLKKGFQISGIHDSTSRSQKSSPRNFEITVHNRKTSTRQLKNRSNEICIISRLSQNRSTRFRYLSRSEEHTSELQSRP